MLQTILNEEILLAPSMFFTRLKIATPRKTVKSNKKYLNTLMCSCIKYHWSVFMTVCYKIVMKSF